MSFKAKLYKNTVNLLQNGLFLLFQLRPNLEIQIPSKKSFITLTTAGKSSRESRLDWAAEEDEKKSGTNERTSQSSKSYRNISSVDGSVTMLMPMLVMLASANRHQCDQIGRFMGLWVTFRRLWQQLICRNLPHSQVIFVKGSKSLIFQ